VALFRPVELTCYSKEPIQSQPQKVFPLAKFAVEARALGDLECRDDAPVDLLAGLSGSFARSPVSPPGLIEVRNKSVPLDGASIVKGPEAFRGFLLPAGSGQSGRAVHSSCNVTIQLRDSTASWQEEMSGPLNAARKSFRQRHQHPKKILFLLEVDDKGILRMKI
jgi:hypothetical protein